MISFVQDMLPDGRELRGSWCCCWVGVEAISSSAPSVVKMSTVTEMCCACRFNVTINLILGHPEAEMPTKTTVRHDIIKLGHFKDDTFIVTPGHWKEDGSHLQNKISPSITSR